jgi:hypothetical protein
MATQPPPPPTNSRCCALHSAAMNSILALWESARHIRDCVILRPNSEITRSGSPELGSAPSICLETWASSRLDFTEGTGDVAGDELSIKF